MGEQRNVKRTILVIHEEYLKIVCNYQRKQKFDTSFLFFATPPFKKRVSSGSVYGIHGFVLMSV